MKYKLVAFDLDGVIVSEWSSWEWVHKHFGVDNTCSLNAFIEGKIDDMEFMRRDIALWLGKNPNLNIKDIREILKKAPLTPGSVETMCELKKRGAKTAVVSGGIDLLADAIGAKCGIDKVMANGLVTDKKGKLLGDGILRVELWNKASALRQVMAFYKVKPEECAVVGNSWVDVTMFDIAGLGIAFNPTDEQTEEGADVIVKSDTLLDILPHLE
jgi:phosphoserine phosphatase